MLVHRLGLCLDEPFNPSVGLSQTDRRATGLSNPREHTHDMIRQRSLWSDLGLGIFAISAIMLSVAALTHLTYLCVGRLPEYVARLDIQTPTGLPREGKSEFTHRGRLGYGMQKVSCGI